MGRAVTDFAFLWLLQVLYKENIGKATPTPVTPEMERVKRNQEIISSVPAHKCLVSFVLHLNRVTA